ncbi:4-alpha-glucanotransferase [Auritidibacter ignavus]|uniref:4-alpha-glucanotransferase n=1 Tax=Auritidibacter ignavus TaxID=678932 RepID=UPI00244A8230|nr:4-alpha-glucanotransferase [Auritidibacter ignavus]WGH91314.1 4-alpha-glucanotransferase [Auritidibacter ignavus]
MPARQPTHQPLRERLLTELAEYYGVQTHFTAQNGDDASVDLDTVVQILQFFAAPLPDQAQEFADLSADDLRQAIDEAKSRSTEQPFTTTVIVDSDQGRELSLPFETGDWVVESFQPVDVLGGHETTATEWSTQELLPEIQHAPQRVSTDCPETAPRLIFPAGLPVGDYQLRLTAPASDVVDLSVIVVPSTISATAGYDNRRGWGVTVQLYSVRSSDSWGIGDFADLARIMELAALEGADFVLTNPLHASEPVPPLLDSPYSPVTRSFLNPLYLRVEDVAEYQGLSVDDQDRIAQLASPLKATNNTADRLDRTKSYRAKIQALRLIFTRFEEELTTKAITTGAFHDFCQDRGAQLRNFAAWCVLREDGRDDQIQLSDLPACRSLLDHDLNHHPQIDSSRLLFFAWLQFLCTTQLRVAHKRGLQAGMRTGVMVDLAVGADRYTADAWMHPDALVEPFSVGAPPDMYNQLGQDWSQHPWNPRTLGATGYRAYRQMLRSVFAGVGAVRIDHILGQFRLWWVPEGTTPNHGAYVRYDSRAMLGILALEAQRAGVLIVGEDLGTVDDSVVTELSSRKILGTSIVWFEQDDGIPHDPSEYRRLCLATVNTHDLPPTAGYLRGVHLDLREELQLLTTSAEAERATFLRDIRGYLKALVQRGLLTASSARVHDLDDIPLIPVIQALHRFIARAPSRLHAVALVDAVADQRIQNQPGTTQDQYPNWCQPLTNLRGDPVLIDDLETTPEYRELFRVMNTAIHHD